MNFQKWHLCDLKIRTKNAAPTDYLEFPIKWNREKPLVEHLYYVFTSYINDVRQFCKLIEDTDNDDSLKANLTNIKLDQIKEVCNNILSILSKSVDGKFIGIDELLWMEELLYNARYTINPNQDNNKGLKEPDQLFRMRPNSYHYEEAQFYHIPFDKRSLTSSERFSAAGYPCLYLGYSKECCIKEVGSKNGSMVSMKLSKPITVIDLTCFVQQNSSDDNLGKRLDLNMFLWWPILAACYVTCDNDARFKEEYLFPQLVTKYILYLKEHSIEQWKNILGIRYYSCKERDLNPGRSTYMNLVLFPDMSNSQECDTLQVSELKKPYDFEREVHDYDLLNKFEFGTPFKV